MSDNGTHLIVMLDWWQPYPPGTSTNYTIVRHISFNVDGDNDRKTGFPTGTPAGGADAIIDVHYNTSGYEDVSAVLYYGNGTYRGYRDYSSMFIYNASSMSLAIPFSDISTFSGGTLSVNYVFVTTTVVDVVSETINGYTVPNTSISLDGDIGDWPANATLYIDTPDPGLPPYYNITEVYMASDGDLIFLMVGREEALNASQMMNSSGIYLDLVFGLDVDGDSSYDYIIYVNGSQPTSTARIYDVSNSTWTMLTYPDIESTRYLDLYHPTRYWELALNLSRAGIPPIAGRTVNVLITSIGTTIFDYPGSAYTLYTINDLVKQGPWFSKIIYTPGAGGYSADLILVGDAIIRGSWTGWIFTPYGYEVVATAVNDVYIAVSIYDDDPNGVGVPTGYRPLSPYYGFYVNNTGNLSWPITLYVPLPSTDRFVAMYYDSANKTYKVISNVTIDSTRDRVIISFTRDMYLAGDDPIIILASPPPSVGGIIVPTEASNQLLSISHYLVMTVGAAALILGYSRMRKSEA
ncbi:MAG: hypothetical protein F7C35_04195 [Desulfurococcales archaeon]|nr:hypothetical protein [Desulfurococcales archaeon]